MMSILDRKGGTAMAPMIRTGLFSEPGGCSGSRPRLAGVIGVDVPRDPDRCCALIASVSVSDAAMARPTFHGDGIVSSFESCRRAIGGAAETGRWPARPAL